MKIKRGTKVTWRGLVNGKPRNRTGIFSYCIDHSDPWATPQALITAMDGGNGSARVEIDRLKVVKE